MKKQIKTIKTKKAVAKKENKKAVATDKKAVQIDFKVALKESNENILQALKKSKQARKDYASRLFTIENKKAISDIASRLGAAGAYDIDASFPCKTDLAKIKTVESFTNKTRQNITARMIAGLLIAYLLRDSDSGFNRIFCNGLFLENGLLKDLCTAKLIKSESGENENQKFSFTDACNFLFKDKAVALLENKLIANDLI